MRFTLNDGTKIEIPKTMMIDALLMEPQRSQERAPYSNIVVTAGDGLPVARPFTISGKAYFQTVQQANDWFLTIRDRLEDIRYLEVDNWLIDVLAADMTAVPVLLPRVLNVTFRVYPADVIPLYFEDTWMWKESTLDIQSKQNARQIGYDFTPVRDFLVTGVRVYSDSTNLTSREVSVWRVSDQTLAGRFSASWSTEAVGWSERLFAPGFTIEGGVSYRLTSSSAADANTLNEVRLTGEVTFDDSIQVTQITASPIAYPDFPFRSGLQPTTYPAVDVFLELP